MLLAEPIRETVLHTLPPADGGDASLAGWLVGHKHTIFRWTMALAGTPGQPDLAARRTFAETAVAVQRLEGESRLVAWLFGEALLAAQRQVVRGVLPEELLAGLAPELRAVLRLVARGDLRAEEAWALLHQPMAYVRRRLVQARLARLPADTPQAIRH